MDERVEFEARSVLPLRRERGNRVRVASAAVAVGAIVLAGVLGPRLGAGAQRSVAFATAREAALATAEPTAEPQPGPPWPATVLGLSVRRAADIDSEGEERGVPIAVAGWYVPHEATACAQAREGERPQLAAELGVVADARTFCQRSAELFTALMFGESVASIDLTMAPGVVVPAGIDSGGAITAVVVVGRLPDPASGCRASHDCRVELVVDSVAWAGGMRQARTTSVLPSLLDPGPRLASRPRDQIADTAGSTGALLMETLVDQATLASVDPAAAAAIASSAPGAWRIWYRLALGADPARDDLRWVAIDDATGAVLGSGSVVG